MPFPENELLSLYGKRFPYFDKIEVIRSDGRRYVFGGSENALEFSTEILPQYELLPFSLSSWINKNEWKAISSVNTWMLDRIEFPGGECIRFTYEKDGTPLVRHDFHHAEYFHRALTPSLLPFNLTPDKDDDAHHPHYDTDRATIGGPGVTVDQVRVYPADAAVESYTWYPDGNLRSRTDSRGVTEIYTYDALGRLTGCLTTTGTKSKNISTTIKTGNAMKTLYKSLCTLAAGVIFAAVSACPAQAQAPSANYIMKTTYTQTSSTAAASARREISYFDGQGRPVQTVRKGASPSGGDLADLHEYDALGREHRRWLEVNFPSGSGGPVLPVDFTARARDTFSDNAPYQETTYDGSPLERVRKVTGPGADGHSLSDQISVKTIAMK